MLRRLKKDEAVALSKSRFVSQIVNGELEVFTFTTSTSTTTSKPPTTTKGVQDADLLTLLRQHKYLTLPEIIHLADTYPTTTTTPLTTTTKMTAEPENLTQSPPTLSDYSYLLDMPIQSLTQTRCVLLSKQAEEARARLVELESKSPEALWLHDLDKLLPALRALL